MGKWVFNIAKLLDALRTRFRGASSNVRILKKREVANTRESTKNRGRERERALILYICKSYM